jgi:heat shock protein 1/8
MAEVEDAVTTIIGLDFGSHMASIALWTSTGKANVEVVADDLGFRMIPTAVAYRSMGDKEVEVITGQSALTQQAKNPLNTFDDVRSLLLNPNVTTVNVPALGKEVTVEEVASHFFRNIHNQIKQQVGKVIRDTVLSLPVSLEGAENEMLKARVIASAQAGGIRIKSFIQDSAATLLSYKFDDISTTTARGRTLVLDLGWSSCKMSIYNVSAGLIFPVSSQTSTDTCGSVFVKLLVEFCAKDFTRKTKCPFPEYSSNNKAVHRLKRECEAVIKSLSVGTEAQIDIDSLYEGMDYSSKITRARFEDLLTIPIIQVSGVLVWPVFGS